MLKKIGVGLCLATLAGCVTLQPYQPAQGFVRGHAFTTGPYPVKLDQTHAFLDSGHQVLYMQNQGGGGLAVGLLLGPLGVAANIAAIKHRTEEDATALKDKIPLDAGRLFADAAAGASDVSLGGDANAPVITPMLLVEKVDEAHVRFASFVYVQGKQGSKAWSRQYVYEMPETYTPRQLEQGLTPAQLEQLSVDAREGFAWAATTFAGDIDGTFRPVQKKVLRSNFVTPRTQIPLNGYGFDAGPGRVGFATGQPQASAVYSLPMEEAELASS